MSALLGAVGSAGAAAAGVGSLIGAVGSLLPSTSTTKGRQITDANAQSETVSGQASAGQTTSNQSSTNINVANAINKGTQNQTTSETGSSTQKGSTVTKGSESFSGQENVRSSQLNLSMDAVNRMINLAFQGTGGLQDTSSGARNAGIFNSSGETMLTNNLLATVTGEIGRLTGETVNKESLGATETTNSQRTSTALEQVSNVLSSLTGTSSNTSSSSSIDLGQVSSVVQELMAQLAGQSTDQTSHSDTQTSSKTKTKKCYLTTVVCERYGWPDDCYTLTVLRKFRDTWMRERHPEDIEEYNSTAPGLVAKLRALSVPEFLATTELMHRDYILPAVKAIESENPSLAYNIYKQMVLTTQSILSK